MQSRANGAAYGSALGVIFLLFLLFSGSAFAQTETPSVPNPDAVLEQARQLQAQWYASLRVFARNLFWLLATIQFIWAVALLALRNSDFQDTFGTLVKQIMFIGFGLALLINAPDWMGAIVNSFTTAGEVASGLSGSNQLAPGEMFQIGTRIAVTMMSQLGAWDLLTNMGAVVLTALCALLILISLAAVTLQVIVIKFELFIVQTAGILLLGFAGSRWTFQYAERYITYAISVGVRLLVTYLVIAIGLTIIRTFTQAIGIVSPVNATWVILEMTAFCLVFCMIVWMLPKLASALMSGALQSSGNELVSGMATMGGVAATAALGGAGLAGLATAGAASSGLGQVARATQLGASTGTGAGSGAGGPLPFGAVSPPDLKAGASTGPMGLGAVLPSAGTASNARATNSSSAASPQTAHPGATQSAKSGDASQPNREGSTAEGASSGEDGKQARTDHTAANATGVSGEVGSSVETSGEEASGQGNRVGVSETAIGPMGFGAAAPPAPKKQESNTSVAPGTGRDVGRIVGTSLAAAAAGGGAVRTLMDGQGDGGQRAAGNFTRTVGATRDTSESTDSTAPSIETPSSAVAPSPMAPASTAPGIETLAGTPSTPSPTALAPAPGIETSTSAPSSTSAPNPAASVAGASSMQHASMQAGPHASMSSLQNTTAAAPGIEASTSAPSNTVAPSPTAPAPAAAPVVETSTSTPTSTVAPSPTAPAPAAAPVVETSASAPTSTPAPSPAASVAGASSMQHASMQAGPHASMPSLQNTTAAAPGIEASTSAPSNTVAPSPTAPAPAAAPVVETSTSTPTSTAAPNPTAPAPAAAPVVETSTSAPTSTVAPSSTAPALAAAPAPDVGSYQDDARRNEIAERLSADKSRIQPNKGKS